MNDYISRESLLTAASGYDWAEGLKTVLKRIPAADVRSVVTCEECVWHVDDGCHNCTKLGMLCPDGADFYCKYGRRPNCGADMMEDRKE